MGTFKNSTSSRRRSTVSSSNSRRLGSRNQAHIEVWVALKNLRRMVERVSVSVLFRRSQWELCDFLDDAVVGINKIGPDGRILEANRAELDLLGYKPEEYIGHHL